MGRAPNRKETLPDFRERCRVTRHPRVFRGFTGYQRTPKKWGVTPDTQVRDFIPWVRLESGQPPDLEEEEEEEMTGLLDCYAARKRKRKEDAAWEADAAPDQAARLSRLSISGSSEEQAIIILGSPKTGSNNRLDIGDDVLGEAAPTPPRFK